MTMPALLALVDCNNFFVSCERVFHPQWQNRPVIVLSNNDGCVISRSNEAKQLGVPMAVPFFKIRDLVKQHQIKSFSPNFELYSDMSDRVMDTLKTFSGTVEVYSIDEAFVHIPPLRVDDWEGFIKNIREIVHRNTGIPVSIGVAPTKTLCKAAVELVKIHKPVSGMLGLTQPEHYATALKRLSVGDVWGVGCKLTARLKQKRIESAEQLKDADDAWILKSFGVTLMRTVYELRGIACLTDDNPSEPRKSLMYSRSFGQPIGDYESLHQALSTYTARAAHKLRTQGLTAGYIQVSIRTSKHRESDPYYSRSTGRAFPVATHFTPEMIPFAEAALQEIYRPGYRYTKIGITLLDLRPASQFQTALFDTMARDKLTCLMNAMDGLNTRLGNGKVRYACEGRQQTSWQSRQTVERSKCYTTRWDDLLVVG